MAPRDGSVVRAAQLPPLPACTIIGTDGPDDILGTPGDDVICARGADDVVRGAGGDDVIFGSDGRDTLRGGLGNDKLYSGQGDDRLFGEAGDDLLQGAQGADDFSGGTGTDTVDYALRVGAVRVSIGAGANDGRPGEGDDVGADVENVNGGQNDDVLRGNGRANVLRGNGGGDLLEGSGGDDTLSGGSGPDRLEARDSNRFVDQVRCGGGADVAVVDAGDQVARDCDRVRRGPAPRRHNHAPTNIVLSNTNVAENQPAGTTVGKLSAVDRDENDRHTFTLVGGPSRADNDAFRIDGSTLKTNAVLDYETKSTYAIRIRVTDSRGASFTKSFTIAVTDVAERVNHAPSDVGLSGATVDENQRVGTAVGTLSATDADAGDTQTFALVAGPGSGDNGAFAIVGSTLETNAVFDFETKSSYSIRVRATDAAGATFEKSFTITVNDLNDPPSAEPRAVTGVLEDRSEPITLAGSDPEGDALTFQVATPLHGQIDTATPVASCDGQTPSHCTASVVYTPDPDFNGPDSFAHTVNDGTSDSPAAIVAIIVDPVNDAPVANDGGMSVSEGTPTPVDLGALVSDVETADADLTYTILSGPAHGTLSGSRVTPTYTPAAGFNGSDSFTYRVTDRGDPDNCGAPGPGCDGPLSSSVATVSISVAPVNDAPAAADATASTDEDTPTPIDLGALVSDSETADANLTYEIVGGPTHGQLTGSAASRTYTPSPDYNGPDSFTYRVTDRGDPDNCGTPAPACAAPLTSRTATVSITVSAVNDAPVNTLPAGPITALQDTNTPITGASISDIDAGTDNVQLSLSADHATLTVSILVAGGVVAPQVTGNGTKTVVVTASLAAINATLGDANGLVYHGEATYTGPDMLTFTTDDLGRNGAGANQTDTDTLAINVVPPNALPVAQNQNVTTSEDTAKAITLSATDADGDTLTLAIATPPAHGSLGPVGQVACTGTAPSSCTANISYTPAPNYNGPDSFTFTANDGQADSAPATITITVTPVNDAPQLQNTEAGALGYIENDPATPITATTTASDIDSPNFDTGTVTVDFATGGSSDDRLEIVSQGPIAVSGSNVTYQGTTIGTFTGGTGTTPLIVTLNANATPTTTEALVRAVAFRNVSEAPFTASRTVRFVLTDGDGGTSAPATRDVAVTAVNDAPTLAGIETAAVDYIESVDSAPAQSQITNTLTTADVDDANLAGATVQITGGCRPGEDVLVFSTQSGITGSYTAATCLLTLTGSSSLANYQAALRSVGYENTSDAPNTATRTVSFQVDDGHAANHASNTQIRDITVTASNDSPTAVADTFNGQSSALAGVTLAVSTSPTEPHVALTGSVLDNDTDPDSSHSSLTASAGTSSTNGGVVAFNADGTFTYTPAPGFTGSDSFTYTVHDNGSPDRADTGTVTINVAGPRVWFVNPGGSAGNGTSASPFASLAPVSTGGGSDSLDGSGDVIFAYQGSGNAANGGFVLEANQRLVGQPQGLSVTNANGTYNLVTAGGANPTITNTAGAGLTLADGNTIQRVNVTNASGVGVSGNAVGTLTYGANTTISGNTGGGLALSSAAGGAIDVGADISTSAGRSVSIANRSSGTTTLSGAISDTGSGISLSSNTGATVSFTGTLNVSTGANDAFTATGGGTVNVSTGATRALTTTTGTALTLNGVGGAISLTDLDKNGSGTGISLTAAGASVTVASGATIANTTTAGVTIDQGTGAFSYAGTISNSSGRTVQVTNRNTGSPGLVQLTGSVTSTGGTGVNLDNNDNGTITFSGGLVLSTGASTAYNATNGGTVNVDNSGVTNTLTTTTGTALNVANTTIGSTGLKFRSISANGAPSGIVLNNTGSSGGLTVTGDGGGSNNGSGGVIQNTTATGVSLTSTSGVSLGYVNVLNSADDGIHGDAITNFTLNRANVDNNGNSAADDGVQFGQASGSVVGVLGTLTITDSSVSANAHNGFWVRNTSGTLTSMSVTGSSFNDVNDTTGANAFLFEGSGTSTLTAGTISGSAFQNNTPQRALEVQAHDTATVGTMTVSGNTFTDNGIHASFTQDTSSNLTFKFINNGSVATPMTGSVLQAVNVFSSSQATGGTLTGTISGNRIGNPAVAGSAGQAGGISGVIQGQTDATLLVDGNIIRQTNGDARAIGFAFRGPAPPLADTLGANTVVSDLTLTNNDVVPGTAASGFPLSAIMVEADNQSGADNKSPTVRADIRGNTVPAGTAFDLLSTNIGFYEYDAANGHGIGQLVDTPPASADATAQLTSTNTGSASAFGVALIPGPITTPP
jgi:hypothetical protein